MSRDPSQAAFESFLRSRLERGQELTPEFVRAARLKFRQFQQLRAQRQQQQQPPAPTASQQSQPSQQQQHQVHSPNTELAENASGIRLTVDLPGVLAGDLQVSVDKGVLTITGARKFMSVDGAVCVKRQKFSRRYAIDTNVVDIGALTAHLSQGVLTIRAPKKAQPQHVQVEVTQDDVEASTELIHISQSAGDQPAAISPLAMATTVAAPAESSVPAPAPPLTTDQMPSTRSLPNEIRSDNSTSSGEERREEQAMAQV